MIKISIVMPCYNMAPFIRDCLDSLQRQTLKEFETICVDDGSTDETPEIIRSYAADDLRIMLITQPNLGVFAARNNAMKVATGEYICFLDPDDWYPSADTLERMYRAASENDADICGGGWSRHHPDGRVDTKFEGFMEGLNTFPRCGFVDYADYQFDLGYQRFLFRAKLIRDNHIEFPPYKRFQDPPFLVKAMVAAGRFYALDFVTYSYRVGHKAVDWSADDYRKLKDYMRGLADNMRVAKEHGLEKLFVNNRDRTCGSFFWQAAGNALSTRSDVFEAYRRMFDDPADFLKSLAAGFANHPRTLASLLERYKVVAAPPPRKIQTIGIHYYHLTMGGVQRVISLQVPVFLKMGYRVTLFIEDIAGVRHFELPEEVEIVPYPRTLGKDAIPPRERIEEIVEALKAHPVDVFYSHAHLSPFMLWDCLTVRMVCRVPFVLHYHSMFTAPLYAISETTYSRFLEAAPQHRLCDVVISLSRGDLAYERMNGVSAFYLPNPVDQELLRVPVRESPGSPLIVWVGRIDEQKCPLDAVRILAKVREQFPAARLRLIGDGSEWLVKRLRRLVVDLKLEESVELIGGKKEVYSDYAAASLCLSTSRIEGFPMASIEALARGLPIVAYHLPQVEIYRGNPAVVQVPQRDIVGAAAVICRMLRDPHGLANLRTAARDSVKPYADRDFAADWRTIFEALESGLPIPSQEMSDEDRRLTFEMLFSGIEAMQARVGTLRRQVVERDKIITDSKAAVAQQKLVRSLIREVESLKRSEAYRVGMFVTWPARRAYRMFKCWKENGLKYTIRRLVLGKGRGRD